MQQQKVEHDSFVCCILSHGTKDSIIGSNSKEVLRDYIEQQAGKNKTLSDKPKIFFLQACRGKELGSEPVPTRRTEAGDDSSTFALQLFLVTSPIGTFSEARGLSRSCARSCASSALVST